MEKRKKIIISDVILVVIIAIIFGIFWFLGGKTILSNVWNKYVSPEKGPSKELIPLNATDEEKKMVEGKTDEQIKNGVEEKKSLCLEDFKNGKIVEAIDKHALPKEQAGSYLECLAIAQEDVGKCDDLGAGSPEAQRCRQNFLQSVEFAFPALRQKQCTDKMISACEQTGMKNCKGVCQAIINDPNQDCSVLSSPQKEACLALTKNDAGRCDSLKQDMDKQFCKFAYFLTAAARANNSDLLSGLELKESYFLAKLYFDTEDSCQELAFYMGELRCAQKYGENYLKHLLEVGRDLRGDYINQPPAQNNQ